MDEDIPQDEYFEWEDIISYKATPAPRATRKPAHLNIKHFSQQQIQYDSYDSDLDESVSSEPLSILSAGAFSTTDSLTTQASMSFNGTDDYLYDGQHHVDFLPSYDDAAARCGTQYSSTNPLPSLGSSQPRQPEDTERPKDDTAVVPTPSRCVDYLSHSWCEEDIGATWKYLKTARKSYSNNERLLNASWRMWMKERHQLAETEPTSINWMKDRDTTWLYGPLQPGLGSTPDPLISPRTSVTPATTVRPILKKPSLSETLLRRSISSSVLVREAAKAAEEAQNSPKHSAVRHGSLPPELVLGVRRSTVIGLGVRFQPQHQYSAPTKSVRFFDEVDEAELVILPSSTSTTVESIFDVSSEQGDEDIATELSSKTLATIPTTPSADAVPMYLDQITDNPDEMDLIRNSTISLTSDSETSDDEADEGYLNRLVNSEESDVQHVTHSLWDPVREDLVDLVMVEFWKLFNQEWASGLTEQTGGARKSSGDSPSGISTTNGSTSATQNQRKRQRVGNTTSDEDDERQINYRQQPTPRKDSDESIKFACPFRKHNSQTYNIYTHRVCALSHWQTIARVKEHIYRCHQTPPHCKRCWITFKSQQQLDGHITVASADICELRQGTAPEGISPVIERQLRSRKKSHPNQTDEERWRDIYKLLFPNTSIPSPYFEAVQKEGPSSPDSRELSNYENYIRRELPRLVRSNIKSVVRRETQLLESALISNLVSIIQDCQDRVFRSYREIQGLEMQQTESSESMFPFPDTHDFRDDLDFLDSVYHAPAPSSNLTNPNYEQLDSVVRPQALIFSDSGYDASEPCDCQISCNCVQPALEPLDAQVKDHIAAPDPVRPWMDSLSHPNWKHVDGADDEADWWMYV